MTAPLIRGLKQEESFRNISSLEMLSMTAPLIRGLKPINHDPFICAFSITINDCPAHQGIETPNLELGTWSITALSMTAPLIRGLKLRKRPLSRDVKVDAINDCPAHQGIETVVDEFMTTIVLPFYQ